MSVPQPPLPWFLRWPGFVLAAVLALAYHGAGGSLTALFSADARQAMAGFARGFFPPAHDAAFLSLMARPLLETVAIAFLGISLALVLALPLSFLAAAPEAFALGGDRHGPVRRGAWLGARLLLNLMRSIPELVWALIFVRALGIGPAAGVLAIGVGYAGVIGKVFGEIFESIPRGGVEGLAMAGAPPLRVFAFGTLPAAMPLMGSYALYRFDCALRISALLGIVGAGGLGQQIELSMKMFAYDEVAAQVVALFALVAGVDWISQVARGRLQRSQGLLPLGPHALAGRVLALLVWGGASGASAWLLDVPFGELFSVASIESIGAFVRDMFPPELDARFLKSLAPVVWETLCISVLGTAIAAVAGLALAYPAAHRLHAGGAERPEARNAWRGAVLAMTAWGARGVANLGRSLPELLWAFVFIFAVGLGPFAGALALGVHTAGVLARLFTETLEEVPPGPVAALRDAGAGPMGATVFAGLPQAFPQLVAYTLYRWEVNIRASAVLGVVGAGGLGKELHVSLGLFQYHRTLALVGVILALVTIVDFASGWLRRRIQAASGQLLEQPIAPDAVEATVSLDLPTKGITR